MNATTRRPSEAAADTWTDGQWDVWLAANRHCYPDNLDQVRMCDGEGRNSGR